MEDIEDTIFEILTDNRIFFCENGTDPITSTTRVMMDCFDVFIFEEGWLFYRLKEDCADRGYIDEDECLIGPCEDYDIMICMAKLFDGKQRIKYIESPSWIEEKEFRKSRRNKTLKSLINEMCQINSDDHNDKYDNHNDINQYKELSDSSSSSDESQPTESQPNRSQPNRSQNVGSQNNFERGYSSNDESEEF